MAKKGLFNFGRKNVRKVIFKLFYKKVEVNKKLFFSFSTKGKLRQQAQLVEGSNPVKKQLSRKLCMGFTSDVKKIIIRNFLAEIRAGFGEKYLGTKSSFGPSPCLAPGDFQPCAQKLFLGLRNFFFRYQLCARARENSPQLEGN